MNELRFSNDWNNKLSCKYFTTIRFSNRLHVGDEVQIVLLGKPVNIGTIIDKKCLFLNQINKFIAGIDTGYSPNECKNILKKMYKNKNVDWKTQNIYLYLVKNK